MKREGKEGGNGRRRSWIDADSRRGRRASTKGRTSERRGNKVHEGGGGSGVSRIENSRGVLGSIRGHELGDDGLQRTRVVRSHDDVV